MPDIGGRCHKSAGSLVMILSAMETETMPQGSSEVFGELRPLLFSIAYRMLGSVMDAEDILQEAFLRWYRQPEDDIQSPKAFLTTVVTRLCIDQLRAARTKREVYVGTWLPEPLLTESPAYERTELADSLSTAFLVLLESLTPNERAAFL